MSGRAPRELYNRTHWHVLRFRVQKEERILPLTGACGEKQALPVAGPLFRLAIRLPDVHKPRHGERELCEGTRTENGEAAASHYLTWDGALRSELSPS
jgi:hypothetical protein